MRKKFIPKKIIHDEPIVRIGDRRFFYNGALSKLAELGENRRYKYVEYTSDEEEMIIEFKFLSEKKDRSSMKLSTLTRKVCSRAGELISNEKWIKNIHDLKEKNLKIFVAKKDGNIWTIKLRPSFDKSIKRQDISSIPKAAKGIYRYIQNGEIVYIGKGNIKERIKDPDRKEWGFDIIEYSIVIDETQQYKWESFWIDDYKENNKNKKPIYNRISGKKSAN